MTNGTIYSNVKGEKKKEQQQKDTMNVEIGGRGKRKLKKPATPDSPDSGSAKKQRSKLKQISLSFDEPED